MNTYIAADGAAQPIRPRGGAGDARTIGNSDPALAGARGALASNPPTNSNAPAPCPPPASCQSEPLPIASAPAPGVHDPERDSDHTAQAGDTSGCTRVAGTAVNGGTATPAGSDIPGTISAHAAPQPITAAPPASVTRARVQQPGRAATAPRAGDPVRGAFFGGEWL